MRKILLLVVTIILNTVLYAQIQRSEKMIAISGKRYYLHKVETGQTMFAIGKAYAVAINEVLQLNNKKTTDLKEGELLKIPYTEPSTVVQSLKYKHYIVKKGDTLYSLAKKFGTTEAELTRLNAGVEVALVEGRRLIVPMILENQPRYDKEYYYHVVQKKETLYSIGRRYGMNLGQMKKNNKDIDVDHLKPGNEVRIPISRASAEVARIRVVNRKTLRENEVFVDKKASEKHGTLTQIPDSWNGGTTEQEKNTDFNVEEPSDYVADFGSQYRMFVFLPLRKSSKMVDYYKGMLVAIQENSDIPIAINVYDSSSGSAKVRNILKQNRELDFIVGPYSKSVFASALPYAKGTTTLVSLLSKNEAVYSNSNVLQINTTEKTVNHEIAKYIVSEHSADNLILFNGKSFVKYKVGASKIDEIQRLTTLLNTPQLQGSLDKGKLEEQLKGRVDKTTQNIVIVPESDYKRVNELLNALSLFSINKVEVVGYYKWKLLPNIDPEILFNLNVSYFTPFHYLSSEEDNFVNAYKTRFESLPNDFSFMGYETMRKLLEGVKGGGRNFYKKPLQKIIKHKEGGYESIDLKKVCFQKDYQITAE